MMPLVNCHSAQLFLVTVLYLRCAVCHGQDASNRSEKDLLKEIQVAAAANENALLSWTGHATTTGELDLAGKPMTFRNETDFAALPFGNHLGGRMKYLTVQERVVGGVKSTIAWGLSGLKMSTSSRIHTNLVIPQILRLIQK